MRLPSIPHSPLVLAALLSVAALKPLYAEGRGDIEVVDPTTGEVTALADIDISALSDEDRADIGDQLAELGVSPRGRGAPRGDRPDLSAVEVTDPTTGETVALGDIDKDALTDEERAEIGDQLAEMGISVGRGRRGGGEAAEGSEADSGGEGRGGRGRGGPGRGGPGGNGGDDAGDDAGEDAGEDAADS